VHERNEEEWTMTKFLIGLLGAGVLATGGYAAATNTDADPARTVSLPGATTSDDTTTAATTVSTNAATTAEDVSGPCDEAEHANDPRCGGATASTPAPAPAPAQTTTIDDDANDDVSGPCDEAEHANDPRCTGGAAVADDDHGDDSGRGDDDRDDDRSGHGGDGEDRSGSNSGKG
jgi:hypothetical protein